MNPVPFTSDMSLEYKVPRLLWENMESVLLAQSKRYVAELARRLGVPEKELLRKVLPSSDSLKIMIQDTQSETNHCKARIQHDKLTVLCRKPVAYGCEYCTFHRNKRMFVIKDPNSPPIDIQRIKDTPYVPPMWVERNNILTTNGDRIGKINKSNSTIKLFVVIEPKA